MTKTEAITVPEMVEQGLAEPIPETDPPLYHLTERGLLLENRAFILLALTDIGDTVKALQEYIVSLAEALPQLASNTPFDATGNRIQPEEPKSKPRPADDAGYL